jgi:hypothetical protein
LIVVSAPPAIEALVGTAQKKSLRKLSNAWKFYDYEVPILGQFPFARGVVISTCRRGLQAKDEGCEVLKSSTSNVAGRTHPPASRMTAHLPACTSPVSRALLTADAGDFMRAGGVGSGSKVLRLRQLHISVIGGYLVVCIRNSNSRF